jgi:NAD(P)-dependent dehydrogenase (short-subunit alcohol dehydrogenase family)
LPLPFSGPSSACKAALEAFADAYRGELGPSGVEFITVLPGNMRTDAPAKSAAAINRVLERMTEEERGLYGHRFQAFQRAFNQAQDSGMRADEAVDLIIAAAEQTPSPIRTAIGAEAASVLRLVREHSDIELDDVRLQFLGLKPGRPF